MTIHLHPDAGSRKQIEEITHADMNLCWTCRSCLTECPVNVATSRLSPLKIVRMANLGLLDEMLDMPEIWYCFTCNRCNEICPQNVKPAVLINYLRTEFLRRHLTSYETIRRYKELFARFQRIRWNIAVHCREHDAETISDALWNQWIQTPIKPDHEKVILKPKARVPQALKKGIKDFNTSSCFTCSECSSACPVFCERGLFDPASIIRMVNLGLKDDLLTSPSIWMCIGCGRCTNACSQLVQGHLMIQQLKELAVEEGAVDREYPYRLEKARKDIYPRFINEVNACFQMTAAA